MHITVLYWTSGFKLRVDLFWKGRVFLLLFFIDIIYVSELFICFESSKNVDSAGSTVSMAPLNIKILHFYPLNICGISDEVIPLKCVVSRDIIPLKSVKTLLRLSPKIGPIYEEMCYGNDDIMKIITCSQLSFSQQTFVFMWGGGVGGGPRAHWKNLFLLKFQPIKDVAVKFWKFSALSIII